MRKHLRLVALLLPLALVAPTSEAAVKAGSACSKVGTKSVSSGKTYTCVKSGKKLVWNKGVVVSVAKPAPSPKQSVSETPSLKPASATKLEPIYVNLTFDNLIENSANVSFTAWKKSSETIAASTSKSKSLTIFTGAQTVPLYKDVTYAMNQVSKLFPNKAEPTEILWIRYNFSDLAWANSTAKEKLSKADYNHIAFNQGGNLADSNCDSQSKNCRGSYQQTGLSGIALVMQGVENNQSQDSNRMTTGMLEAHEYFHALQRIPIMFTGVQLWPPAWWREGGAEWVQNMSINYSNYDKYQSFLRDDCSPACLKLSESDFVEFLSAANGNFLPTKFDSFLNYSFGSHVIEILVALRGADALIDMYAEMGKGKTFSDAFQSFYGLSWNDAIPLLAKSVYLNLHR
jgi:hypothetical protein